jgi:hypothetical protein
VSSGHACAIPLGFQFAGDQPIRGIDMQIPMAGQVRFIARASDGAAMLDFFSSE